MLNGFVWFKYTGLAINMSNVSTFDLCQIDGKVFLRFFTIDGKEHHIDDRRDVATFLTDICKMTNLPDILNSA